MKDIARELGVSVATVSRALKDSPRISASQKKRIQAYAKERNFYPNVIGEALRHSRIQPMKVIGVIVPEFVHYYFMSVLSGIEEEARARGYRVMVAQSNERYDKEVAICDSFYKNKVCGIIVSQAKDTKQYDHFRKLMDNGVPLVFYDRICTGVNGSRVVVDDYMGAYTAVTHLIDTGCKRIAFYGSPMNLELSKNRYNGYHDALAKHGLKEHEGFVKLCDNRAQAEAITPEILSLPEGERPDAFFAINDDTAIGILYTAKRMGRVSLNPLRHLDVVGFCDEDYSTALDEAEKEGAIVNHGLQSDVHPFYTRCHCAVLPSYHEGMANVMLEASSTGRPVITTRVPGCQETFDEGKTGFGCEVKSTESLVEAMRKFLSLTQDKRREMGLSARTKMEMEYDRNIVLKAYKDEIAGIVAGPPM